MDRFEQATIHRHTDLFSEIRNSHDWLRIGPRWEDPAQHIHGALRSVHGRV